MTNRRPASVLLLSAAPLLLALETANVWSSGNLSAGRNDTLVCTALNRTGGELDMHVALKDPSGDPIASFECSGADPVPHGASCSVEQQNPSAIPLVAGCHVSAPVLAGVTGNLQVLDSNGTSRASSDLLGTAPEACPSTSACVRINFQYTDGHSDVGTFCEGDDIVSGLHVPSLHVSCSDQFIGGVGQKSDLGGHVISSWSIEKLDQGGAVTCSCSEVGD